MNVQHAIEVIKPMIYDWGGWNEKIFLFVNSIQDPTYDKIMLLATAMGSRTMLPVYLAAIIAYALCMAVVRRIKYGRGNVRIYLRGWLSIVLVIVGSFVLYVVTVGMLKHWIGFPRPFVGLPSGSVRQIGDALATGDFYASFPSGHATFATLMITAIWPVLWPYFRTFGICFVVLVCWSRMALGVHFPADVLGGVIIGFVLTRFIQRLVYRGIGYV